MKVKEQYKQNEFVMAEEQIEKDFVQANPLLEDSVDSEAEDQVAELGQSNEPGGPSSPSVDSQSLARVGSNDDQRLLPISSDASKAQLAKSRLGSSQVPAHKN